MMEQSKKIWVTLTGLPLTIELEWPFHRSTSGADFWVLHGDIRLENSDGLHAPMAVNLSATVREVMASLEPKDAEAPVINALRKEVDKRQVEFLKSGKLKPVAFSSRHYDFKRQKWVFGKAADDEIATFVERKVYWETKLSTEYRVPSTESGGGSGDGGGNQVPHRGSAPVRNDKDSLPTYSNSPLLAKDARNGAPKIWIGDPTDAQYLETTPAHLLEIAGRLVAGDGLVRIEGEWAEATAGVDGAGGKI